MFGAGTNGVKITFSTYDLNHSFSFVWRDGHVRDFVLENEEKEIFHIRRHTRIIYLIICII